MSDDDLLPEKRQVDLRITDEDRRAERERIKEGAKDRFSRLVNKAITTVEELCEMGDSESVRLDAAKTILKMAEVDPSAKKEISVSVDDKRQVRADLEATLEALKKNNPEAVAVITGTEPEPDVVDAELVGEASNDA